MRAVCASRAASSESLEALKRALPLTYKQQVHIAVRLRLRVLILDILQTDGSRIRVLHWQRP